MSFPLRPQWKVGKGQASGVFLHLSSSGREP